MASTAPEPWLRGSMAGVNALVMPVFFSFAQVREDLAAHVSGLTAEQVWRKIGSASLGFHLKHIAGSVDRLTTYLVGAQLSPAQLRRLKEEALGKEEVPELLRQIERSLHGCEESLLTLNPHSLYESRTVGRQALPTTVIGLLVHLAEHTQRHLGQGITIADILRQPS